MSNKPLKFHLCDQQGGEVVIAQDEHGDWEMTNNHLLGWLAISFCPFCGEKLQGDQS